MQVKRRNLLGRKNGSFLEEINLKERLQKYVLNVENQANLQKNCPKKEIAAKPLEQAQIHANDTPFSDVESLLSLDDDYFPQALVVMAYSTSVDDSNPNNEDDSDPEIQTIYKSQPIIAPITNPTPIAQVHILFNTYSKPILVIALFNIGATTTILHPKILPTEFWLPYNQMFQAANGETFLITQKSKPIFIRIFPTLTIKHQVLGSLFIGRETFL